jgi:cell division protein FtsZ
MLADATHVLVQVAGGAGLTLSEVEILMQELGRHVSEQTQILFGAAVDGRLGDRLSVTIISSLAAEEDLIFQSPDSKTFIAPATSPAQEEYHHAAPQIHIEPACAETTRGMPEPLAMEPVPESISLEEPVIAEATPAPTFTPSEPVSLISTPQKRGVPHKEEKAPAEKSAEAKQEVLQFEPVTRGRFEKSEPTIVEGEDLDVPTYLRKNIKVK